MLGMLANSFQRSQRKAQGVATFKSGYRRWLSVPRRLQKRNDLRAQRFDIDDIEMVRMYAGPCATRRGWRKTAYRSVLSRVVDRDIIVRLKEAHLANLFRAHSRSRDVRHCTRRKFETRIRSVDFIGQNRDSYGVDVGDFNVFADEPLHDVDVQRACRELAHAMNLEIHRLAHVWTQRDHRRVETLEMTDL